jgi:hypothetical protein
MPVDEGRVTSLSFLLSLLCRDPLSKVGLYRSQSGQVVATIHPVRLPKCRDICRDNGLLCPYPHASVRNKSMFEDTSAFVGVSLNARPCWPCAIISDIIVVSHSHTQKNKTLIHSQNGETIGTTKQIVGLLKALIVCPGPVSGVRRWVRILSTGHLSGRTFPERIMPNCHDVVSEKSALSR